VTSPNKMLQWAAPERNKAPILAILQRVLPAKGTVLEVASGSGQHIAYFAEAMPQLTWLPSDPDPENLASIRAYREAGARFLDPRVIDVRSNDWDVGCVEAVFCANMIHIAPWSCTEGLFEGVGRNLEKGGVFVLYGPFRIGQQHTAPSNAAFDASLRGRDPSWGVRDLEAVTELAALHGLALRERIEMPANNQTLVFVRTP
jgi:SAM-dependent methyltransferase